MIHLERNAAREASFMRNCAQRHKMVTREVVGDFLFISVGLRLAVNSSENVPFDTVPKREMFTEHACCGRKDSINQSTNAYHNRQHLCDPSIIFHHNKAMDSCPGRPQ
jgi:hypothetical protein